MRRENGSAAGDRSRKDERAVEPLADFLDQSEGRKPPCMSARTGCDGDEAGRAFVDGLARIEIIDDIMQRNSAPVAHCLIDVGNGTQ